MSDICQIDCIILNVIGDNTLNITLESDVNNISSVEIAPLNGNITLAPLQWIDYVTSQISDIVLTTSFNGGTVTEYTYKDSVILYRYEKDDDSEDSFYLGFDNVALTGLVVTRYINPIIA